MPKPRVLPLDAVAALEEEQAQANQPKNEKGILDALFAKAFTRYVDRDKANKGVEMIAQVVQRIQSGESLKSMESTLLPVLSEQASKTTILQGVILNHQMELAALFTDMRWQLMRDMWEDLKTQKLSPVERLALMKLACSEAEKAEAYINARSAYIPTTEAEPLIEKADKMSQEKGRAVVREELEGTTSQGRDIIRRLTSKAKKAAEKMADEIIRKAAESAAAEPVKAPTPPPPPPNIPPKTS